MKKQTLCGGSFLTITITITTNKRIIRNKTLTGKKKAKVHYLLHPNYEETTFSNMQPKHHIH